MGEAIELLYVFLSNILATRPLPKLLRDFLFNGLGTYKLHKTASGVVQTLPQCLGHSMY